MSQELTDHLQTNIQLSEEDALRISARFKVLKVKKKFILLDEGASCHHIYFVSKGCLRLYFLKENGTEQTTSFALERWWLTDFTAFQNQNNSAYSIQAVENSEVLSIDYQGFENLLAEFPILERHFRIIHQRANAAAQTRIRVLYEYSREHLYHQFVLKYPGFVQRVPQYLLASFLGISPEYLSEIRKKTFS